MSGLREAFRRLRAWALRLLAALASRLWAPSQAAPVTRILIVEMTRLGDLVAATALLEPLRREFPGARIEVAAAAEFGPLFEGTSVRFHGLPRAGWAFLRAAWRLRGRLSDPALLLVSASPAVRNSMLALLSSPGRACGYLFPAPGAWLAYDVPAPLRAVGGSWKGRDQLPPGRHMVERAALVLRVAGIPGAGPRPALPSAAARHAGRVVLHAGANWDRRRWPLDRFVALAGSLAKEGADCVLLTAEAGEPGPLPPGVRRGDGLDLGGLRDLLASAGLFIGNDSGPMHLAAALGTPCLGLFGPNLAERSGPWPLPDDLASPHRVLWEDVPCRPCGQVRCVQPWDWCMGKLTVERVLAEARAMLAAGNAGTRKDENAKSNNP